MVFKGMRFLHLLFGLCLWVLAIMMVWHSFQVVEFLRIAADLVGAAMAIMLGGYHVLRFGETK